MDFDYPKSLNEFYYKDILWNNYTTENVLKKVEQFEFLPTDIVIYTFPRSGTTASQEIIWQITHKTIIKKGEKYGSIDKRFPFIEFNSKFYDEDGEYPIDTLNKQKSESYRLIKTHCPLKFIEKNLLKAKPKLIVVFRNPRDVCVSMFHFYKGIALFGPWKGDWETFCEMFYRGFTKDGPWLDWHEQMWAELNIPQLNPNPSRIVSRNGLPVLLYSFETLMKQPQIVIEAISEFIEQPLTSQEMEVVLFNSNFKHMSSDPSLNVTDSTTGFTFLRKGQIGNWKDMFTTEQLEKFKEYLEDKCHSKGMNYQYE